MRLDQLEPYIRRIAERREHAKSRTGVVVEAIEADTDMMQELVGAVRTLRLALDETHKLVDDLRKALHDRPKVTVEAPKKTRARQPPAEQQPEPAPARDEAGNSSGGASKPTLVPSEAPGHQGDPGSGGTSPQGVVKRWTCGSCGAVRVTLDGFAPHEWNAGLCRECLLKHVPSVPF